MEYFLDAIIFNICIFLLYQVGLKQIFQHEDALNILARSVDPSVPVIMTDAVKLMAAMCLVPPNGYA